MSSLLTSVAVFFGLFLGAYSIAVLHRLMILGPRHLPAALILPLVESASLVQQEDAVPRGADGFLFRSAPFVALSAVALGALVLPLGPGWIGFDPSIGLFYFIVVLGPFVIAMMNAGWGQNGKEGLFGCFRAAVHLLGYEVPLGFAAIGPVMAAESLSTVRIVQEQSHVWYAVWQPLGVVIYLIAALCMTFHHPFDIPQAGSELEGGVLSAYSGARFLIFNVVLNSLFFLLMAMCVVLFLGGWHGPVLPGPMWMALKTFALAALVIWMSRFVPRLRQDQLLSLSWKILLPASLVNVTLVGILTLMIPGGGS